MKEDIIGELKQAAEEYGCEYSENAPLRRYTTFGIGGICPLMIEINGETALKRLLLLLRERNTPFYVIGKGSNLLVDDKPVDMVFLRIGKAMGEISREGNTVICGAGASLSSVCSFAEENSLSGMEFAYGIPGSSGGAVYMNAGAYGGEIGGVIEYAEAMDEWGNIVSFSGEELKMSYRSSVFCHNGYIVTKAAFRLKEGKREDISAKMKELTQKRREKQPLEFKSAGSTFRRPEGAYAAALIEQCGLKGYSVGDAQVSEKHSGFVINRGNASFEDVMAVIEHVREIVREKTGYELKCEPEIIWERR